jgi:flavin reductase (DIM6/NTAB) family NADH-FMN oxidoreductase RutF
MSQRAAAPDGFRDFMADFPTGVSVLTSAGPDGRPVGCTCSALCSVTLTPPTLLVCVTYGTTLATLLAAGRFAVNLLGEGAAAIAQQFSAPGTDRFTHVTWSPGPVLGMLCLRGEVCGSAECLVAAIHPAGDHVIVLGRVAALVPGSADPLLYGRRRFAALARPEDDRYSSSSPAPAGTLAP